MALILGIDPGLKGGACLVDTDARAVLSWGWWHVSAGKPHASTPAEHRRPVDGYTDVGAMLALNCDPQIVAMESTLIRTGGKVSPTAILSLTFGAGELWGSFSASRPGRELIRVKPAEWAALCGGTGRTQSERAWRMALGRLSWVCDPPSHANPEALGAIGEAAMMALWAGGLRVSLVPA